MGSLHPTDWPWKVYVKYIICSKEKVIVKIKGRYYRKNTINLLLLEDRLIDSQYILRSDTATLSNCLLTVSMSAVPSVCLSYREKLEFQYQSTGLPASIYSPHVPLIIEFGVFAGNGATPLKSSPLTSDSVTGHAALLWCKSKTEKCWPSPHPFPLADMPKWRWQLGNQFESRHGIWVFRVWNCPLSPGPAASRL